MHVRHKAPVKWAWLLFSLLALTLSLVACGNGASTTTTTPPSPDAPTATPSVKDYAGDGYTLSYPQNWQVTTQAGIVHFSPSNGDQWPNVAIRTAAYDNTPGTPGVSLDQQLSIEGTTLTGYQGYQSDTTVPATASLGGDTWKESGAMYNQGGQGLKTVILGGQHPASTGKIFIIDLNAQAASYDQDYRTTFQAILQSFKFS